MGVLNPILLFAYGLIAYGTYFVIINHVLFTKGGLIFLGLFLLLSWYFINLVVKRIKQMKLFQYRVAFSSPKLVRRSTPVQPKKAKETHNQNQVQTPSGSTIVKDDNTFHYRVKGRKLTEREMEAIKQKALQELDALIGMEEVKDQTKRFLNHIVVEKERERRGMKTSPLMLHMMFLGDAGTGKTTVARIMGKFLLGAGILSKGQFIETDREGLVGQHVGHTAPKTLEKINEATGGVLFIDEAYSLAGEGNDFGQEAITVLVKAMEDRKHDLVVIFAGYSREMQKFLNSNSGLKSRIPYPFTFPNYQPHELYKIAISLMNQQDMETDVETQRYLHQKIKEQWELNGKVEGNGRWVRNLVEQIRIEQNNRIINSQSKDLKSVYVSDIQEAIRRVPTNSKRG